MAGNNRCVIRLSGESYGKLVYVAKDAGCISGSSPYITYMQRWIRIYGSHAEAKKQLPKWLPEWPDAKIVDAGEV